MSGEPTPRPVEAGWTRLLPLLLVPVSLLPDLGAALPLRTYFFRDFTVTFLPLRLFAARELREGRVAFWNPFVFEGTFQLPAFYPADLLHALWPSPVFVSWLLTMHLPLSALTAYWLARELGATRAGSFTCGAVYSLGGLALSSLNLYVFLQALSLAPLVAGLARRAALRGGRHVVVAAAALALALATLAVEFVAQAVILGAALALWERPRGRSVLRLAVALLLGAGLAGLPVSLVLGLLPETVRGAGLEGTTSMANDVHPATLLQAILPNLFGLLAAPAEAWWGGRFFTKGFPYFLSVYAGPLTLAVAAVGLARLPRRVLVPALGLALVALWVALGERGGLAAALARLPLASALRYPAKALLLPHLVLALTAGFGVADLASSRERWSRLAALAAVAAVLVAAVVTAVSAAGPGLASWAGVVPAYWPFVTSVVRRDGLVAVVVLGVALLTALAVRTGRLRASWAGALLSLVIVADLARAGTGLNRQVDPSFFDLAPGIQALRLDDLGGGRVFSYGVDRSPALRAFLGRASVGRAETTFRAHRQVLGPYTNVLDGVESPEATDLTAFSPRARELEPANYEPGAAGRLVPWLRNAAVARVLSLDPIEHPAFAPLAREPLGSSGLVAHAYALRQTLPRAFVACRVVLSPDTAEALVAPFAPAFDPARDVAMARRPAAAAGCTGGSLSRTSFAPGHEGYAVVADGGAGYLVVRASFARGWRARVDGAEAPVDRANGKHVAVAVPPGRHVVELDYRPPGLAAGLAACLLAIGVAAAITAGRARG